MIKKATFIILKPAGCQNYVIKICPATYSFSTFNNVEILVQCLCSDRIVLSDGFKTNQCISLSLSGEEGDQAIAVSCITESSSVKVEQFKVTLIDLRKRILIKGQRFVKQPEHFFMPARLLFGRRLVILKLEDCDRLKCEIDGKINTFLLSDIINSFSVEIQSYLLVRCEDMYLYPFMV
ncbi:MAG: hypothetical protein NZO16_01395 [Deltaproteobacteria bacterium]|nr:hypothetical protein [Deltaproteobacteria bacterium]